MVRVELTWDRVFAEGILYPATPTSKIGIASSPIEYIRMVGPVRIELTTNGL